MDWIKKGLILKLVNLTPHAIHYYQDGEVKFTLEPLPGGPYGRCSEERVELGEEDYNGVSVKLYWVRLGEPQDLPDEEPDTYYVVSRITVEAAPYRGDLIYPDLAIRDGEGKIIGCEGFGTVQNIISSDAMSALLF